MCTIINVFKTITGNIKETRWIIKQHTRATKYCILQKDWLPKKQKKPCKNPYRTLGHHQGRYRGKN